jgi:hypothetical protein
LNKQYKNIQIMAFRVLETFNNLAQDENGVKVIKIDSPIAEYDFESKQPAPADLISRFNEVYKGPYSYFGCVIKGRVLLTRPVSRNYASSTVIYYKNEFFSVSNCHGILVEPNSIICLIKVNNYQTPCMSGNIEPYGRLKYIDGAYNSLLMSPPKKGDPCLNALYMKGKIDQTPHTHPSTRIGAILRGQVTVRIWDSEGEDAQVTQELRLSRGDVWFMDRDTVHSFHTENDDDMALFAFHPDSDFGPTDEEAPMINRTIVDGVSASEIKAIRTK